LFRTWESNPSYSHGYFVPLIALYILWQRRGRLAKVRSRPRAWAWGLVLAILAGRALLFERNELWFENATIPAMIAALLLALRGWALLRWALPGLAYLAFMFPLPPSINLMMAAPLQRLATWGSLSLLRAFGLPVLAEGNILIIGPHQLFVEQACNGLSMLMT